MNQYYETSLLKLPFRCIINKFNESGLKVIMSLLVKLTKSINASYLKIINL